MLTAVSNHSKEFCNFSLGFGHIEFLVVPQMCSFVFISVPLLAMLLLCSSLDFLLLGLQDSDVSFSGKPFLKSRVDVFCFPLLVYLLYTNFLLTYFFPPLATCYLCDLGISYFFESASPVKQM